MTASYRTRTTASHTGAAVAHLSLPGSMRSSLDTSARRLALLLLAATPAVAPAQGGAETPASEALQPRIALHGFADVTLRGEWYRRSAEGRRSNTGFAIGQFDLYMVSRLTEGISFLGEAVFEFVGGEWIVDVERVLLTYAWSDYLRLTVGRGHTALGYWNEAYHHGSLLYPTVERPEALKFEDDGGVLPVHFVGVELSGIIPAGRGWGLGYVANIANGRGRIQDEIQNAGDLDRDKAVALKLSLVREGTRTIRVGPSVYRDRIPPDPETDGRDEGIDGIILGGHLVYDDPRVQFLAEAYDMRHDYERSGRRFEHAAWYSVLVAKLGQWNPYLGMDRLSFARGDLFFPEDFEDLTRYLGGVRFDVSPFNAVKLELRHDRRPSLTTNALAIQTAFTF